MSEFKVDSDVLDCPQPEAEDTSAAATQRLAAIGELLAGISHESRNLLSGILSFAQVGQRRQNDPEKMAEILVAIEQEALRCIDLHTTVLKHARNEPELVRSTIDAPATPAILSEIIHSAVRMVEHQARMNGQKISVNTCTEHGKLLVGFASAPLRQVLLNVLLNAMQATPRGGLIRLVAAVDDDSVRLSVEDSGPGVPQGARQKVFEALFTTKKDGTGLGLAITRTLVVANNSAIDVSASELGGARFTITMPRAKDTE